MKVENMKSSNGNKVANQFVIHNYDNLGSEAFQSYESVIVLIDRCDSGGDKVKLDRDKWDYSRTTGKYRNQFLGETKKETQAKIDSGEYVLTDLN